MASDAHVMTIKSMSTFLVLALSKMHSLDLFKDFLTPELLSRNAYGRSGQVLVNLARLVAKNAFTLRTLASWVSRLCVMAR